MATFNVLYDSWIPVEDMKGNISEYGILGILEKAHILRAISDSSPLIEYGIYRLLIAFLTDALRPKSITDLKSIYSNGKFSEGLFNQYIRVCEKEGARFNLFDKEKPFLQSAWIEELDHRSIRSVALLIHDLPSGNNPIHYDHRLQEEQELSPEICARALCAVNVFCTSGTQGPHGINGEPPWYVLVSGKNLFERLVFNICMPNSLLSVDNPPVAWRNSDTIVPGKPVQITSYLYGLTWQSRRICLIPEEKAGYCSYSGRRSPVLVKTMAFQKGLKFEGYNLWRDPHMPRKENESGIFSVKPREEWMSWYNMGYFMLFYGTQINKYQYYCPEVVHQYISCIHKLGESHGMLEVQAYGLITDRAKYKCWIREKYSLYIKIAKDENLKNLIIVELANIEKIAALINSALYIANASQSIKYNARRSFFNTVQKLFLGNFQHSLADIDTHIEEWQTAILKQWYVQIKTISFNVFENSLKYLGNSSRMLEKTSKARAYYNSKIKQLLKSGEGEIICKRS